MLLLFITLIVHHYQSKIFFMSYHSSNSLIRSPNSFGFIPRVRRNNIFFPFKINFFLLQIRHFFNDSGSFKMRKRNSNDNRSSGHRISKVYSFTKFTSTHSKVNCPLLVNPNIILDFDGFLFTIFGF